MKKQKGTNGPSALRWIDRVAGRKKLYIVALVMAQMLLGISGVFYAFCLRGIIDEAVEGNRAGFLVMTALLAGLTAVQILIRAFIRFMEEYTRSGMENCFKERLFDVLLRRDYASVTSVHSGEWMNRLTSDTAVVAEGLIQVMPGLTGMLVRMIGAIGAILVLEPGFGHILIPAGAVLLLFTYVFRRVLKRLHKKMQEEDGRVRVCLQENLGSLMVVKSFAREDMAVKEAVKRMEGHRHARMRRNHFSNVCNIGFGTVMHGAYVFGVGYFGCGILKGTISYGTLMAVLQLIGQIQTPLANITGYLPKFYAMTASAERLMEAESYRKDTEEELLSVQEIRRFYRERFMGLGLRNAGFAYQETEVLRDVNLEIHKGDCVSFTGLSGCGKSTIMKLLLCLYPLKEGERYLSVRDGAGNAEIPFGGTYRRLFAYVPQGNHLMSGTIREIVAFADRLPMDDGGRIKRALDIACADFVDELADGIDTVLGERGAGLSEGQMQRIAIARAVFSDSPVLILDEATSALDEETERMLLDRLRGMTDRTILIVTHRPAALAICNRHVYVSESRVRVAEGECIYGNRTDAAGRV